MHKCDHLWENRPSPRINWSPLFACTWKLHLCTIQKHQALDDRLLGVLLQMTFYQCYETTRVYFMVLRGINRLHGVPACSSCHSWPPSWIVSVCVTYWRHSTVPWVWMVALTHLQLPNRPRLPTPPSRRPSLIDSIRDITGTEKAIWKTSSIQVAYRISYKLIAI